VLLCTGWGPNKDLVGALKLYMQSGLHRHRQLDLLGLAGRREIVDDFCRDHPELEPCIHVLPVLSDREVVQAYELAAWVWVHSNFEGYGRSIAEARSCGCSVAASNIAPFREQRDQATFLYRGLEEFTQAISDCEAKSGSATRRDPKEHILLQAEIRRFIKDA
jgi:glycosyltransferase involved in cell wall biosynthesis